jgi:SAM-dependent methyltransferase
VSRELSDWDYRGLAAEAYDLWFGEEPFPDQAFFEARLRAAEPPALDVGCGTGRLLLPFLRDGLAVEGVDASEPMLAICRRKAERMGLQPVLHRQHVQALDLPRRYGTILVPGGSFQILARRDEAREALRRLRAHLVPGGTLWMALSVPWRDFAEDGRWRLRRAARRPEDGATVMIHECTRSDRHEQLQHIALRLEVWKDGALVEQELRTHRMRWMHPHEAALLLECEGFRDVAVERVADAAPVAEPGADDDFVVSGRA